MTTTYLEVDTDENILSTLKQQAHTVVTIQALATGFSKEAHGQVSFFLLEFNIKLKIGVNLILILTFICTHSKT